jgi:hypothetical protein
MNDGVAGFGASGTWPCGMFGYYTRAALTVQLFLPPGYQGAIIFTLAERLWPLSTNQIATHRVSLVNLRDDAHRARQSLRAPNALMARDSQRFRTEQEHRK